MQKLVLYQPPPRPWGTPNLSPFCAKLECYLRIAEIPYDTAAMSRSQAPKGKVPYVALGDGTLMGDSQLIIEELERRLVAEGKRPVDEGLSARDAAVARFVRRALEEGFYFIGLYARWKTDAAYGAIREEFKKFVPGFVMPLVRRDMMKKLHAQGTGRHHHDEIMAMGVADLDAAAELLGDRPFLLGELPRTVDCVLYAFLEAVLGFPIESPLSETARHHANLVSYRKRIRERWWKDLPAVP